MSSHERGGDRKEMLAVYGPLALIVILGLVVALRYVKPAPPDHVTIASGEPAGAYHAFAQRYARLLKKEGITLEIVPSSGSVENLGLLKQGKVDMAFIQGGIGVDAGDAAGLEGLGSLYFEPLWLFLREGLQVPGRVPALRGLKVSIGPDGSGTQALVLRLLKDNGFPLNSPGLLKKPSARAAKELESGELDAAFFVSSPKGGLVRGLLHSGKVVATSFERAEAYARRYPFLTSLVLPEGAEDLAQNLPDHDLKLLATTSSLVVREELHPAVVALLMQVLETVHGKPGWFNKAGEFPSPDYLAFPLNPQAARYYKQGPPFLQRYLPFWLASFLDRIKIMLLPLLGLMLPAFKVVPPLYRWRMRSRIYRWYDKLEDVDTRAANDPDADPDRLRAVLDSLESEVRDIRVPLSFSDQLYHLRLHIDLVRKRMEEQLAARGKGE